MRCYGFWGLYLGQKKLRVESPHYRGSCVAHILQQNTHNISSPPPSLPLRIPSLPPSLRGLQTPKAVVHLHPSFEVSLAHTSGYKFPLRLSVAGGPPLFLAAANYHQMNQWLFHLQTQRLLVDKWGGSLALVPTGGCVILFDPQSRGT